VLTDKEQENLADIKTILTDKQKQKQLDQYSRSPRPSPIAKAKFRVETFSFNNDKGRSDRDGESAPGCTDGKKMSKR